MADEIAAATAGGADTTEREQEEALWRLCNDMVAAYMSRGKRPPGRPGAISMDRLGMCG